MQETTHNHVSSRDIRFPDGISNGAVGMILFLAAETMFFAGLISAYLVFRSGTTEWPPVGQPRLPVEQTAFNTALLLLSGFMLAGAILRRESARLLALRLSLVLGAAFVVFQGREWIRLIGYGLTATSSLYGSFFYLIVGAHAVHAVAGLLLLGWVMARARARRSVELAAPAIYWFFVVGLWPILYWLVYLA